MGPCDCDPLRVHDEYKCRARRCCYRDSVWLLLAVLVLW